MSLRGNVASLTNFSAKLRQLPTVLGQKIAAAAAVEITELARQTFNAGEDSYGDSWVPGSKGQAVTLHRTGSLANYIQYVAIGTKLRVSLGVSYAKYQIGKRPIFPKAGEPLPTSYVQTLKRITAEIILAELRAA